MGITKQSIQTQDAPSAVGPYSQAVVANGLIYCSGQIPIDPAKGEITAVDVAQQTHQVMKNLSAVLRAGNSHLNGIIKTTIYLKSLEDFGTVNEVYQSYLEKPYPARVTIEVSRLPLDCLVEIDAVAQVLE